MFDRMLHARPGRGRWKSTSTISMPASAASASAASWARFSTSGSHTAKPSVDDQAARSPVRRFVAAPESNAASYDGGFGNDVGSTSVGPATASTYRAASRTDRHIGPGTDVS